MVDEEDGMIKDTCVHGYESVAAYDFCPACVAEVAAIRKRTRRARRPSEAQAMSTARADRFAPLWTSPNGWEVMPDGRVQIDSLSGGRATAKGDIAAEVLAAYVRHLQEGHKP